MDMPNAASFIKHFLDNSGEDYLYDAETVIKGTQSEKNNYIQNINDVIKLCESAVIDELWFISKPSIQLPGTDFSTTGCKGETAIAIDWWSAIGGGQNALASEVKCKKTDGSFVYTAKIRYYVLDVYDWENKGEENFANLHKYGYAENFLSYGCYETTIEWQKGSRYPYVKGDTPNYIQTTFSGIRISPECREPTPTLFYIQV